MGTEGSNPSVSAKREKAVRQGGLLAFRRVSKDANPLVGPR